jgi:phosphatidylserine decarboxylase
MIYIQYLIPHRLLNKLANLLGNCSIKWVKNFLIYLFLKCYCINLLELKEYEQTNPFAYKSYNDFFTRKLRDDVRKSNLSPVEIISPADGSITQYGEVKDNLFNIKGSTLSLVDLFGGQNLKQGISCSDFSNGKFITIYLAPHNYHRVHMPITATLKKMIYVPGKLFSVNNKTINKIPNVFTRNERVIALFNSNAGNFAIVLIGAMIVGSIVTSWHGIVTPAKQCKITCWNYENGKVLNRGEEMGLFQLGSTVMVLFDNNNKFNFSSSINCDKILKMGEAIGSYLQE